MVNPYSFEQAYLNSAPFTLIEKAIPVKIPNFNTTNHYL